VIPSMPGYGFSGRPTTTGWDPVRIARAWAVLMRRLGYTRFVAQGGDWGAGVCEAMATQAPPGLLAIHINLPATVPPEVATPLKHGQPPPSDLTPDELDAYKQLQGLFAKRRAYAQMMGTRPQTLSGLADSPVGLAAWMLDHGDGYSQPAPAIVSAVLGGAAAIEHPSAVTRDDVLDNITLYWLTNTGVSAGRLYWENKLNLYESTTPIDVPTAVSVFPGENYRAPRRWAERAYSKLIYYNRPAAGGHFAAWEQPQVFAEELRAGFRSLRA
jgi:pimeloyl-ACP methyl ester carboxylesterase